MVDLKATIYRFAAEYSDVASRRGPDSNQARAIRDRHADNPEFLRYADVFDRIMRSRPPISGGMAMWPTTQHHIETLALPGRAAENRPDQDRGGRMSDLEFLEHAATILDGDLAETEAAEVRTAIAEIGRLRTAIRKHRDQEGDDRCYLDDSELYDSLGEADSCKRDLPPKCEFLKSCERFWESRQPECSKRTGPLPGEMTIAQLEGEIARLGAELVAERRDMRGIAAELDNVIDNLGEKPFIHQYRGVLDIAVPILEDIRDRMRRASILPTPSDKP